MGNNNNNNNHNNHNSNSNSHGDNNNKQTMTTTTELIHAFRLKFADAEFADAVVDAIERDASIALSLTALTEAIEADVAAGIDVDADVDQTIESVFECFERARAPPSESVKSRHVCATKGALTRGKLMSQFAKEVKKRPTHCDERVSDEAVACRHDFFGDAGGGADCQLCGVMTKARVWKCRKQCDVLLCGSCAFKWRKQFLS